MESGEIAMPDEKTTPPDTTNASPGEGMNALARSVMELEQALREMGYTVRKVDRSHSGRLQATFVSKRPQYRKPADTEGTA